MSGSIRSIFRMNLNYASNNVTRQFVYNGVRALYSEVSLGLPEYKAARQIMFDKYKEGIDTFRSKLQNTSTDGTSLIFTEDLKAILHLAEKTSEDIALLEKMIEKYNSQSSEMRFSTFKFGPVVMRAFHYLNEPDVALKLFQDSKFDDFFSEISTFMILLDLLYENGKYKEVREVYDKIRGRYEGRNFHPKLATNVVATACLKENTPESLEYGTKICKELSERGSIPLRRIIATFGVLALQQKAPHIALELIASCKHPEYLTIRSIRIIALAELDRLDDVILDFQNSLQRRSPVENRYLSDIVPAIERAIKRLDLGEDSKISNVLQLIQDRNFISLMTLEQYLSQPITILRQDHIRRKSYPNQNWSENQQQSSEDQRFNNERREWGRAN